MLSDDNKETVNYKTLEFLDHPGYRVGDDGTVWTRWKILSFGCKIGFRWVEGDIWKKLTPGFDKDGYPHVMLHGECWPVHKLVLNAFVGPRPEGMVARHYPNQDKTDNRLSNLSWTTKSQNMIDKRENGTWAGLENNPAARLTNEQVREIRSSYKPRVVTLAMLAMKYGVSNETIQKIVYNENWKELK